MRRSCDRLIALVLRSSACLSPARSAAHGPELRGRRSHGFTDATASAIPTTAIARARRERRSARGRRCIEALQDGRLLFAPSRSKVFIRDRRRRRCSMPRPASRSPARAGRSQARSGSTTALRARHRRGARRADADVARSGASASTPRRRCSSRATPARCRRSTRRSPRRPTPRVKQRAERGARRRHPVRRRQPRPTSSPRSASIARARRPGCAAALLAGLPAEPSRRPSRPPPPTRSPRSTAASRSGSAVQNVWYGLSLGSVLLLAAIGLAITFGVMGVINMAHGEMVMLGAYTTFVVQEVIRAHAPALFDYSLADRACRSPSWSRAASASLIERGIIRFLYGRPLETLLATWGLSLILQQAVRTDLRADQPRGRQPVLDERRLRARRHHRSPTTGCGSSSSRWPSSSLLLGAAALHAARPADARRDAEPRAWRPRWASAPPRIDALTFGLGSGIAGIAGVALVQIDNVCAQSRPGLHHRQLHGRGVRRRRQSVGHAGRRLHARHRQQVPRALCRRRARQDRRCWCSSSCSSRSARAACSRSRAGRWKHDDGRRFFARSTAAAVVLPRSCCWRVGDPRAGARTCCCRRHRRCTCRPIWSR